MIEPYTTNTDEVRAVWQEHHSHPTKGELGGQFDRWLAGVKAEVWDEAMATIDDQWYVTPNPYRTAPNA